MDKVYVNVDRYGNTSSASIPIALDEAIERGRMKARDRPCCWSRSAPASRGRSMVVRLLVACRMDIVLLFPGQGSQKPGMGKDLAEALSRGARRLRRADAALGVAAEPRSASTGRPSELTLDANAQPALLAHGAAVWAVVRDDVGATRARRRRPLARRVHGVSRGGRARRSPRRSRLVRRRGELMFEAGTTRPGAMAAILGTLTTSDRAALRDAPRASGDWWCRRTTTPRSRS